MSTIAQELARKTDKQPSGKRGNGKIEFLALKNEIEDALSKGWSALQIWQHLDEQKQIHIKYAQFNFYIRRYIKGTVTSSKKTVPEAKSPSPPPKTPEQPAKETQAEQVRDNPEQKGEELSQEDEYSGLTPRQKRERIAQKYIKDTPGHPLIERLLNK